jgi:hypothetical protein
VLLEQPRQAPPVERVLRILLGLVLMVYVAPIYFQVPVRVAVASLLLMLGLIGVYSLIHIVVSRRVVPFGPCFGAVVASGLLVRDEISPQCAICTDEERGQSQFA